MRLAEIDIPTKAEFATQFRETGMVVLRGIDLPDTFVPVVTDVVLLRMDNTCEVYIGAWNAYRGENRGWRRICQTAASAGDTRLVTTVRGDLFSGLTELGKLLDQAGGEVRPPRAVEQLPEAAEVGGPHLVGEDPTAWARVESLTRQTVAGHNLPELEPSLFLNEDEVYRGLRSRVRGQDHALRTLSRRLCAHLARRSPPRPATIFATGPTGVGKTTLAQSLVPVLRAVHPHGGHFSYLRLDMTEYQEEHRVSQLFGAPPGYLGYGEGAPLTDALVANARTVVLFDEIEKAHPAIHRALMNVMDAGRLTSPSRTENGRVIDARRAIFFFTSNCDASGILQELEDRQSFDNSTVVDTVCRRRLRGAGMPPEILGRIGCFLVLRPLSATARAEIVTQSIARVAGEFGLMLAQIEPSVVLAILNTATSVEFGARPDEYAIDETLGPFFLEAARSGIRGPLKLQGPPFICAPIEHPTNGGKSD